MHLEWIPKVGDPIQNPLTLGLRLPPGIQHGLMKWFTRNVPQLNKVWVWADDAMSYGKMKDPRKYWKETR